MVKLMQLLDGKSLAAVIRSEIQKDIQKLGIIPGLAVVLVGSDSASQLYVGLKEKAAAEVGIHFERHVLPQNVDQDLLLMKIEDLNADPAIHGILVQLPLPAHLDEDETILAIRPEKDVDGFHPKNIELLLAGTPRFIPSLIRGILALLDQTQIQLQGLSATIMSNSNVFASPLQYILQKRGMNVFLQTANILAASNVTTLSESDIIISVLGIPHGIRAPHVKEGAALVDVGTTRMGNETVGDVHPDAAAKASWVTPVPGGVGPMTVAMLLWNTVEATKLQKKDV